MGIERIPPAGIPAEEYRARLRFAQPDGGPGFVYFVEAAGTDRVKIGYAGTDPLLRMADLQVGSPTWLDLIAVIEADIRRESAIHLQLNRYRLQGEWFLRTDRVQEAIGAARALMKVEHHRWCKGGDEYERWDAARKRGSRTPEEIAELPYREPILRAAPDMIDILDGSRPPTNYAPPPKPKPSPRGWRKANVAMSGSGHFSIIDQHRAERKAARSNP